MKLLFLFSKFILCNFACMRDLSVLNSYFKKYKGYLLLGVIFVLLTNYFRILYPQITGYILNTVLDAINNKSIHNQKPIADIPNNAIVLNKKRSVISLKFMQLLAELFIVFGFLKFCKILLIFIVIRFVLLKIRI